MVEPANGGEKTETAAGEGKREGIREEAARAGVTGYEQEGSEDERLGDAREVTDEVVQECYGLELPNGHAAAREREAPGQTTVFEPKTRC